MSDGNPRRPALVSRLDAPALAAMALAVVVRVRHFTFYEVPNSDFFAFAMTAQNLWAGEGPGSYQRPPLYSILMGPLAGILPGADPMLAAAITLNIALFGVTLVALYLLARRFVGYGAFFVVLLFGLDPNVVEVSLQPLAQTLAVALTVGACLAAPTRANLAWLCAALASVSRYEGAALLPALFAHDLFRRRPIPVTVIRGALASVPLLAWLALNYRATGSFNPYHAYFGDSTAAAGLSFMPALTRVLQGIVTPPLTNFLPMVAISAVAFALTALGFVAMARRAPLDTIPIAAYFAITLAMNMVFFAIAREHVVIFSWAINLAMVAGLAAVARPMFQGIQLRSPSPASSPSPRAAVALRIAVIGVLAAAAWSIWDEGIANVATMIAVSLTIIAFVALHGPTWRGTRLLATGLAIPVAALFARQNLHAVDRMLEPLRHVKGAVRHVGEWARDNTRPDELVVLPEPWVAAHYAGAAADRLLATAQFEASTHEEFVAECRARGVRYVVWDFDNAGKPGDFYHTRYRIGLIEPLRDGRSTGDFELVEAVQVGTSRAFIYRLRP